MYGGRSPLDPTSRQPLVTDDSTHPLVGFVDGENFFPQWFGLNMS
jgi:hypothetical protein